MNKQISQITGDIKFLAFVKIFCRDSEREFRIMNISGKNSISFISVSPRVHRFSSLYKAYGTNSILSSFCTKSH